MGAWGVKAFENDTAGDWALRLEAANDLSLIEDAISCVENSANSIDSSDGEIAIAASEILACLCGSPGCSGSISKMVDDWVKAHPIIPSPMLLVRAYTALEKILGRNSDLCELWHEADEEKQWVKAVRDLHRRLGGSGRVEHVVRKRPTADARARFTKNSVVVISQFKHALDCYNSWGANLRMPAVGEHGRILQVVDAGVKILYVVESISPGASRDWLADFEEDEIRQVEDGAIGDTAGA